MLRKRVKAMLHRVDTLEKTGTLPLLTGPTGVGRRTKRTDMVLRVLGRVKSRVTISAI